MFRVLQLFKRWYVVVLRATYDGEDLPPYAVGPFFKKEALEELDSESGTAFSLMTIDAKSEQYIAYDCFMVSKRHLDDDAEIVGPYIWIPLGAN